MARPAAILSILVEANTGKASKELKVFNAKLDKLANKKVVASAKIDLKGLPQLTEANKRLTSFGNRRSTASAKIDVKGMAGLTEANQRVTAFGMRKATAKAEVKAEGTVKAGAEIDKVARDRKTEIKVDTDRGFLFRAIQAFRALRSSMDEAESGASLLAQGMTALKGAAGGAGGGSSWADHAALSFKQWGLILIGTLPIIIDLTAALGALAASAGAAAAGVGALAVGGAGAGSVGLAGIVSIAAPAVASLKNVITAMNAMHQGQATGARTAGRAQQSAAQAIKTANEGIVTANRAVQSSEQSLTDAQKAEQIAQQDLNLARQQATRDLQDMKRAADEAGLSEARSRIGLQQAEANLRQLEISGTASALDLKDAELGVQEARAAVKDATIQGNRAQADYQKAQQKGLNKMPGVVAAQRSLHSATENVAKAQQGVKVATEGVQHAIQNLALQQSRANTATTAGVTQMAALQYQMRKAGPEAVKFARELMQLKRHWLSLTQPGRDTFFKLLQDGLDRINHMLPMLAKSANTSMRALRTGFGEFLKQAMGPEFRTFIHVMTDTFAKATPLLGDAFGRIAKILERIAVAAAPEVIHMINAFDHMIQGWDKNTQNAGKLAKTIHMLVGNTWAWIHLIEAAAKLIVAIFIPGINQGKKAVQGVTAQLHEWTNWVKGHPKEMRDFFKQGVETTKELFALLLPLIHQLFVMGQAMRPIAQAILDISQALLKIHVGPINALMLLLGGLIAIKFARWAIGVATDFGLMGAAAATATVETEALGGGLVAVGSEEVAAGLGSTVAGLAAFAVPLAAIGAATFTKGGIMDTLTGKNSADDVVRSKTMDQISQGLDGLKQKYGNLTNAMEQMSSAQIQTFKDQIKQLVADGRITQQDADKILGTVNDHLQKARHNIEGMHFGHALADQLAAEHGNVKKVMQEYGKSFQKLPLDAQNSAIHSAKNTLDGLRAMGAITKKQERMLLGALRDRQQHYWHEQRKGWRTFGEDVAGFFQDGFLSQVAHVAKSIGEGLTGAINDWITGHGGKTILGHGGTGEVAGLLGWLSGGGTIGPGGGGGGHHHPRMRHAPSPGRGVKGPAIGPGPSGGADVAGSLKDQVKKAAKPVADLKKNFTGLQDSADKTSKKTHEKVRDHYKSMNKESVSLAKDMDTKVSGHFKGIDTTGTNTAKDLDTKVSTHFKSVDTTGSNAANDLNKKVTSNFSTMRNNATAAGQKIQTDVVGSFQATQTGSINHANAMKVGVGKAFDNLHATVVGGINQIGLATNKALKALGVNKVDFGVKAAKAQKKAKGGSIVGGSGSGDKVPAMLEPGEIVWNRDAVKAAGRGLMAWNNLNPRKYAKGGKVDSPYRYPIGPGVTQGRVDMGVDYGGTGPIGAIGSGRAVVKNLFSGSGYGTPSTGLVYKMDAGAPTGFGHTSDSIYIYEGFNRKVGAGRIKAGEVLGNVGIPGDSSIEMGFAVSGFGGTPLGQFHAGAEPHHTVEGENFAAFLRALQGGKGVMGGRGGGGPSWKDLKRVMLVGPGGAMKQIGQASLDQVVKAANTYGRKHSPKGMGGGALPGARAGNVPKSLPPSLKRYDRTYPSAVYPSAAWSSLPKMPFNKVAELAEWAGKGLVPGVTMADVSLGEGDLRPGSESTDGGYGMWGYTPSASGIVLGHSGKDAHNPIIDAQIMAAMYRAGPGRVPPSNAIWHGYDPKYPANAHYQGKMMREGGLVQGLQQGGVVQGMKQGGKARKIALIGDSLSENINHLYGGFPGNWDVDAQSGRHSAQGIAPLKRHRGGAGAIVWELGTNDTPSTANAGLKKLPGLIGNRGLALMTTYGQKGASQTNKYIRGDKRKNALADWQHQVSRHKSWVAGDSMGIHPNKAGAKVMRGQLIRAGNKALKAAGKGGGQDGPHRYRQHQRQRRRHRQAARAARQLAAREQRIKDLGVTPALSKRMDDLTTNISVYADFADRASLFGGEVGPPSPPGSKTFDIHDEAYWLNLELTAQLQLRNAILLAERQAKRAELVAKSIVKKAQRRIADLQKSLDKRGVIKHEISKILHQHPSLNKDVADLRAELAKKKPDQKKVAKFRNHLAKYGLTDRDGQIDFDHKLAALTPDKKIKDQIAATKTIEGVARTKTKNLSAALKVPDGSLESTLISLQGSSGSHKTMKHLPEIRGNLALFGGDILQTQIALRDLSASTSADDNSALVALLKQQNLNLQNFISTFSAQKDVFSGFPKFAKGGVVPGPMGAPLPAIVHGGETITPPGKGTGVRVVVEDHRTRVFIDEKEVRAIVKDETRQRRGPRAGGRGY